MRKSPTAPKKAFQIPTVEEVVAFMNKMKPDWPNAFCVYYGNKFWHSYNSKSWRISRNVMMKDWHSAFFANWADVTYDTDKKRLEAELKSWTHRCLLDEKRRKSAGLFAVVEGSLPTPLQRFLESLDAVFEAYRAGNVSDSQLRNIAEWLSRNNFQGVTPAQMDQIIIEKGNNGDYGKILIARQFFANLLAKGWTISDYVRSKTAPNQQIKTA